MGKAHLPGGWLSATFQGACAKHAALHFHGVLEQGRCLCVLALRVKCTCQVARRAERIWVYDAQHAPSHPKRLTLQVRRLCILAL